MGVCSAAGGFDLEDAAKPGRPCKILTHLELSHIYRFLREKRDEMDNFSYLGSLLYIKATVVQVLFILLDKNHNLFSASCRPPLLISSKH